MSDILADAREWLASHGDRIQTHSGECHRWHPACLVARLLRELDSRAGTTSDSDAYHPERDSAEPAAIARGSDRTDKAVTLTISCTGDICERLRREIVWEPEVGKLLAEAADEIERLRITDAEREAVRFASVFYAQGGREPAAAALRGLLERSK